MLHRMLTLGSGVVGAAALPPPSVPAAALVDCLAGVAGHADANCSRSARSSSNSSQGSAGSSGNSSQGSAGSNRNLSQGSAGSNRNLSQGSEHIAFLRIPDEHPCFSNMLPCDKEKVQEVVYQVLHLSLQNVEKVDLLFDDESLADKKELREMLRERMMELLAMWEDCNPRCKTEREMPCEHQFRWPGYPDETYVIGRYEIGDVDYSTPVSTMEELRKELRKPLPTLTARQRLEAVKILGRVGRGLYFMTSDELYKAMGASSDTKLMKRQYWRILCQWINFQSTMRELYSKWLKCSKEETDKVLSFLPELRKKYRAWLSRQEPRMLMHEKIGADLAKELEKGAAQERRILDQLQLADKSVTSDYWWQNRMAYHLAMELLRHLVPATSVGERHEEKRRRFW